MIELVMVIVIISILAAVAMPRMDTSGYKSAVFHDRSVAALRYAQKTASSHRRLVCVAFTASTVTLTIAQANPAAVCNTALTLPGSNVNNVQSGDAAARFNPVPANFNFLPDGRATDTTLSIADQPNIIVVGTTGHVQ